MKRDNTVYRQGSTGSSAASSRTAEKAVVRRADELAKQVEKDQIKAAKRAEQEKVRLAKQAEAEKTRLARQGEQERAKLARVEERKRTQEQNRETKIRERAERESAKAVADFYSKQAREQHKQALAVHRKAKAEHERIDRIRQGRTSTGNMALNAGIGLAGGALAIGASAITAGAGYAANIGAQKVRADLDAKKLAAALSTSSRVDGKGVDPERLLAEARGTAKLVKGTTAEDVLRAQQKYVQITGDLESARKFGATFATTSKATGADMTDIAATAATFASKFGVKDERGMQQAFAQMMMQGRKGAFELSDASSYYEALGAAGSRFGMQGESGLRTLGGLSQIARMSTGNGATASTAVQAMLRQIVAKGADSGNEGMAAYTGGKKVGKKWTGGTKIFTDDTRTKVRDINDVLPEIIGDIGGDLGAAQKIFGEEGIAGVSKLLTVFSDAASATGSKDEKVRKEAGVSAVKKFMAETINAGGSWEDVKRDASTMTGADDGVTQLDQALTEKIGNALTPVAEAMAENLDKVTPLLEAFADGLVASVDTLGVWGEFMAERFGGGKKDKKSADPIAELAGANKELGDLEELKKKSGGLTIDQRRRKRELESKRVELTQQAISGEGVSWLTKQMLGFGSNLEDTPEYKNAMASGGAMVAPTDSRFDNARDVGERMMGGSEAQGGMNIASMGTGGFGALAGLLSLGGFATKAVADDRENSGKADAAAVRAAQLQLEAAGALKAAAAEFNRNGPPR